MRSNGNVVRAFVAGLRGCRACAGQRRGRPDEAGHGSGSVAARATSDNQARKRTRARSVAELISIIVTTYRREDALAAVLRALARQTDADFELVVADDGSGPETAALIDR